MLEGCQQPCASPSWGLSTATCKVKYKGHFCLKLPCWCEAAVAVSQKTNYNVPHRSLSLPRRGLLRRRCESLPSSLSSTEIGEAERCRRCAAGDLRLALAACAAERAASCCGDAGPDARRSECSKHQIRFTSSCETGSAGESCSAQKVFDGKL